MALDLQITMSYYVEKCRYLPVYTNNACTRNKSKRCPFPSARTTYLKEVAIALPMLVRQRSMSGMPMIA